MTTGRHATSGSWRDARLRPFRTTAFKLSVVYLAVFTIFAAFLIGYIARNTNDILRTQMRTAVDLELKTLAEQYRIGGIGQVARLIANRSRQPGASLYLVTDGKGAKIAGNVESVPREVIDDGRAGAQIVPYLRTGSEAAPERYAALVRVVGLPQGFRVLVGRDVTENESLAAVIRRALILTVGLTVVLGLVSWLFVSRRVLRRIDTIADAGLQIVGGDLSGRIEVTGSGDEFDRLAESLNAMLARIEGLMAGLKQVSDNIAHDLKTPLTRMRNRVEAALADSGAGAGESGRYREALQGTIEEADQLIRTFNALLMIARLEAGSSGESATTFDAAAVVRDVHELYEPLAEEAGVSLVLEAGPGLAMRGNRELIGQALANLVDNAVKYAAESAEAPRVTIAIQAADEPAPFVLFRVADNGPGIPEADRRRVTERFVRLEESRSKPGAGLGLSLVSAVTQLHRGELVLRDNGPGLIAELSLPRGDATRLAGSSPDLGPM